MDVYLYKMSIDCGGAPCATRGLLSLAICKPQIRARAKQGALIFGFGANEEPMARRLIYIANITEPPLTGGDYYRMFRSRPDCIYEWRPTGRLVWRRGSRFHHNGTERKSDIGSPLSYAKATVLLSRDFRYFGRAGTIEYANAFPLIKITIEEMGRAYRVHHELSLRAQLLKLKRTLWRKHRNMIIDRPTSHESGVPCNTTASDLVKLC